MKRDYTPEPAIVRADKKFNVENADARGFSLRPGLANRGGFPVLVTCDGRPPFRVDSSAVVPHTVPFNRLVIDTTPGGGVPGDQWRVELYEVPEDVPSPRLLTNSQGAVLATRPGAKTLFSFDYQNLEHLSAIRQGFQNSSGVERYVYVDPEKPSMLKSKELNSGAYEDNNLGKGFDLSEFRQVLFGVEMLWFGEELDEETPFYNTTVEAYVGAVGPHGGGMVGRRHIPANFGMGYSSAGLIHLGSGYGGSGASEVTSYLPPFAHFYFYVENTATPLLRLDGEFVFRFWAVGY